MGPFLPFLIVGGGELWLSTQVPVWAGWFVGWAGAATSYVSLAYFLGRPRMLGKLDAPRVATLALMPYHMFASGAATLVGRQMRKKSVEVSPGLWVGAWPRQGVPGMAQLDLTAELPRRGEALRYACVPMLDGAAAREQHFLEAVQQARQWRKEGLGVLVHCAYGHGRSVAVCIGVMVAEGLVEEWEEAHRMILHHRPRARMTAAQRQLIARMQPHLHAMRGS